jgi:hypothetical protein
MYSFITVGRALDRTHDVVIQRFASWLILESLDSARLIRTGQRGSSIAVSLSGFMLAYLPGAYSPKKVRPLALLPQAKSPHTVESSDYSGLMFWLTWKKLFGSYFLLTSVSRS